MRTTEKVFYIDADSFAEALRQSGQVIESRTVSATIERRPGLETRFKLSLTAQEQVEKGRRFSQREIREHERQRLLQERNELSLRLQTIDARIAELEE